MNRKYSYKDMDKFTATRNRQKRRYYGRTQYAENHRQPWSTKEIDIIMKHEMPDNEISKLIGRSVGAIQSMRGKIKNG